MLRAAEEFLKSVLIANNSMSPLKSSNIDICVMTSVHPTFDDRIFHKECKSLVRSGYKVTLLARHCEKEFVDGIEIIPLPMVKNRFVRIICLPFICLIRAVTLNAKVCHIHDPELLFVGFLMKVFGKKVVYDVHEDVAEQILLKNWIGNIRLRRFISFIYKQIERILLRNVDVVIAATDHIANIYPNNNAITLRNMPILEYIDSASSANVEKTKSIILYSGGLTRIRGIKEIIKSMEIIRESADLWLIGWWENESFELECKDLKGWKYAKYWNAVPYGEHYALMKKADIGIINFLAVPNQIDSLPNKPFEYMACQMPIVMSDFPVWRKYFNSCAMFTNPSDPEDIAKQILYLLSNKEIACEFGRAGREMVETSYNWNKESIKLINEYSRLIQHEISDTLISYKGY